MPALSLKIKTYSTQLGPKMGFGTQTTYFLAFALIKCVCESNYRLDIYFLQPDSAVPAPFFNAGTTGGTAGIFLPFSHYGSYIDLLRNESPVFASIYTEKPEACNIYSGTEPVGEGEL